MGDEVQVQYITQFCKDKKYAKLLILNMGVHLEKDFYSRF